MIPEDTFTKALNDADLDTLLSGLPQRSRVDDQDAIQWCERLKSIPVVERAYAEFIRLHGIDASETVAAVQMYATSRSSPMSDPFASPRDLAASKLLQVQMRHASQQAIRTEQFKPAIIAMFLEQMGASRCASLEASCKAASGQLAGHEWLIGSPDLIANIGGRHFLIGIHAPEKASEDIPFHASATLHHLRELCRKAKVNIDGMLLASYDWSRHTVLPLAVPSDQKITDAIYRGGDMLWESICNGQLPARDVARAVWAPAPAQLQHQISSLEDRLLKLMALKDGVETELVRTQEQVNQVLGELPDLCDRAPTALGLATLHPEVMRTVDSGAVAKLLAQKNMSHCFERLLSPIPGEYDTPRMAARLLALGEDLSQYQVERLDPDQTASLLADVGLTRSVLMAGNIIQQRVSLQMHAKDATFRAAGAEGVNTALETVAMALEAGKGAALDAVQYDESAEAGTDPLLDPLGMAETGAGSEQFDHQDDNERSEIDAFLEF